MPQHTIELVSPTGRIRLVPPRAEDDAAVASLRTNPETLRHLRFLPSQFTSDDARARRENRSNNPTIIDFHIHVKNDDGSINLGGQTGLFNVDEMNNSCEIGIIISPHLYRGGYATEALYAVLKYAFDDRKMHRASFETGVDNLPMCSWLEQVLGATMEGRRRECWSDKNGGYTDVHSYSILEREWSGQGGAKQKLERRIYTLI